MTKKKTPPKDAEILQSWHDNADPWIHAIENKEIESRQFVTNPAIVEAVVSSNPKNILDLGCGEGWLSKVLNKQSRAKNSYPRRKLRGFTEFFTS